LRKNQKAKLHQEASSLLERARETAKLKRIPAHAKNDIDAVFLKDGTRYEEIMDDLHEMHGALEEAGLTLADIGTDEAEIEKLKQASDRLNAPHRERLRRKQESRSMNDFGYDDL